MPWEKLTKVLTYVADVMSALSENDNVAAVCIAWDREAERNVLLYAYNNNDGLALRLNLGGHFELFSLDSNQTEWSSSTTSLRLQPYQPDPQGSEELPAGWRAMHSVIRLQEIRRNIAAFTQNPGEAELITFVFTALQNRLLVRVEQPWDRAHTGSTSFLHAEMCLVNHIFRRCLGRPRLITNAGQCGSYCLGVTRLCCGFCEKFLRHLEEHRFRFYRLGTHRLLIHNWTVPPFVTASAPRTVRSWGAKRQKRRPATANARDKGKERLSDPPPSGDDDASEAAFAWHDFDIDAFRRGLLHAMRHAVDNPTVITILEEKLPWVVRNPPGITNNWEGGHNSIDGGTSQRPSSPLTEDSLKFWPQGGDLEPSAVSDELSRPTPEGAGPSNSSWGAGATASFAGSSNAHFTTSMASAPITFGETLAWRPIEGASGNARNGSGASGAGEGGSAARSGWPVPTPGRERIRRDEHAAQGAHRQASNSSYDPNVPTPGSPFDPNLPYDPRYPTEK